MGTCCNLAVWTFLAFLAVVSSQDSPPPISQECAAGLEACVNDYSAKASVFSGTDMSKFCVLLDELAMCVRKLDACDQNYILSEVIPGAYQAANSQGLNCPIPMFATEPPKTVNSTTARSVHGSTSPSPCMWEAKMCRDDMNNRVPYASYSEYCGIIYNYQSCMWSIYSCDYNYVSQQIEKLVGDNLRDCDKDSQVSGQANVRSLGWLFALTLLTVPCLVKALFARA